MTRGRFLANKAVRAPSASTDLFDRAKQFNIKIFYIEGGFPNT